MRSLSQARRASAKESAVFAALSYKNWFVQLHTLHVPSHCDHQYDEEGDIIATGSGRLRTRLTLAVIVSQFIISS